MTVEDTTSNTDYLKEMQSSLDYWNNMEGEKQKQK